jgi:hypothetical protein
LRALRVWHDATSSFGLRMAIARKRQISRAYDATKSIVSGSAVTFVQYRRLLNLYEHLFVLSKRRFTWVLWDLSLTAGLLMLLASSGPFYADGWSTDVNCVLWTLSPTAGLLMLLASSGLFSPTAGLLMLLAPSGFFLPKQRLVY